MHQNNVSFAKEIANKFNEPVFVETITPYGVITTIVNPKNKLEQNDETLVLFKNGDYIAVENPDSIFNLEKVTESRIDFRGIKVYPGVYDFLKTITPACHGEYNNEKIFIKYKLRESAECQILAHFNEDMIEYRIYHPNTRYGTGWCLSISSAIAEWNGNDEEYAD